MVPLLKDPAAPWLFESFLPRLLVVLSVVGLVAPPLIQVLPIRTLLDGAVFLSALWNLKTIQRRIFWLALIVALLFAFRVGVALISGLVPAQASLQASEWIAYLLVGCVAVGKRFTGVGPFVAATKFFTVALAVRYAYATATEGFGTRPTLLIENNYELALSAGLVAVLWNRLGQRRPIYLCLFAFAVVLSGSLSGAIALLILLAYVLSQSPPKLMLTQYLFAIAAIVAALLPVNVYNQRTAQGVGIDRLNFLNIFLGETSSWTLANWIFGTWPVTPLSATACGQLSFYQSLFADSVNGVCYAVILHVFILRVIFDTGLLGLLIVITASIVIMRSARVPRGLTLCLTLLSLSNSASVSGYNNVFVFLPILVAVVLSGGLAKSRMVEMMPIRYATTAARLGHRNT